MKLSQQQVENSIQSWEIFQDSQSTPELPGSISLCQEADIIDSDETAEFSLEIEIQISSSVLSKSLLLAFCIWFNDKKKLEIVWWAVDNVSLYWMKIKIKFKNQLIIFIKTFF